MAQSAARMLLRAGTSMGFTRECQGRVEWGSEKALTYAALIAVGRELAKEESEE